MNARITKAEAGRLARQARQHGYFDLGADGVCVKCPRCHEPVQTKPYHRTFPARKGQPANVDPGTGARTVYRRETVNEALDRVVIEHVTEWCEALGNG